MRIISPLLSHTLDHADLHPVTARSCLLEKYWFSSTKRDPAAVPKDSGVETSIAPLATAANLGLDAMVMGATFQTHTEWTRNPRNGSMRMARRNGSLRT